MDVVPNDSKPVEYDDIPTRRGGVLVHAPVPNINEFSSFVQPFVSSLRNAPPAQISNQAWVQHMIQLHSTEGTGKRKRAPRGGKRKRSSSAAGDTTTTNNNNNDEELVWSLENVLEGQKKSSKKNRCKSSLPGEEETAVLQYLQNQHHGNVEAAKFNVLVKVSGGQGKLLNRDDLQKENGYKRATFSIF